MTYEYHGTVVRWVDGDTVELTLDLGFHLTFTDHFRLEGIDTAERGKPLAAEAKAYANELAPPGTKIIGVTSKGDKYGRWLVYVYKPEHDLITYPSVNKSILDKGLAKPYWGGTKDAN